MAKANGKSPKGLVAIKKFMERKDCLGGSKVPMSEIKALKSGDDAWTSEDIASLGEEAREELEAATLVS